MGVIKNAYNFFILKDPKPNRKYKLTASKIKQEFPYLSIINVGG